MKKILGSKWFEIVLVGGLVLFGSFLRLYRFRETLMFQGDQGRDALIVKQMIKDGNLTLLGPVTSVGNMYLGPFYYYFMAPFLALSYPDPIGPAYGVAIVNILLLVGIYLLAKEMFGKVAAVFVLIIYTLMVPAISISRFSWNPNLAPAVSAMLIWCLWRIWARKQYRKIVFTGLLLGILAQLHYMALVMVGVTGLIMGIAWYQNKSDRGQMAKYGLWGVVIFASTWLPLLVFNYRHDNLIAKGFQSFFQSDEKHMSLERITKQTIPLFEGNANRVLYHLVSWPQSSLDRFMFYGTLMMLIAYIGLKRKTIWMDKGLVIVLIALTATILGMSIYSGSIEKKVAS